MEFEVSLKGDSYRFSFLDGTTVLVTGRGGEYILYKTKVWRCADDLPVAVIRELGEIIEEHMAVSHAQ